MRSQFLRNGFGCFWEGLGVKDVEQMVANYDYNILPFRG